MKRSSSGGKAKENTVRGTNSLSTDRKAERSRGIGGPASSLVWPETRREGDTQKDRGYEIEKKGSAWLWRTLNPCPGNVGFYSIDSKESMKVSVKGGGVSILKH